MSRVIVTMNLVTWTNSLRSILKGFDEKMYAEPPDVYEEKLVRAARKNHRCCECGKMILVGWPYGLVKGLWDGHWSTYKQCMYCVDNARWYDSFGSTDEPYAYTQLYYEIAEMLCGQPDFDMSSCPWPELIFELSTRRDEELTAALRQNLEDE